MEIVALIGVLAGVALLAFVAKKFVDNKQAKEAAEKAASKKKTAPKKKGGRKL